MNALLLGMIVGLTITISIGPGFIALFQTTLSRGFFAGMVFATGMLLSDIMQLSISYFGFAELLLKWDYKLLGVIAGLIIIVMGVISLFRSSSVSLDLVKTPDTPATSAVLLLKGFLLNSANPFSLIFWIGLVGFAGKKWGLHNQNVLLFFTGVFLTAFSTDLAKSYLSGLLIKVLNSKIIHYINQAMGLVFVGIGCFIILKVQ